MSTPRTQDKRHWVRLEIEPDGERTGAMYLDLNMVDQVMYTRKPKADNPDFVDQVKVMYAGTMQPLGMKDEIADWFYHTWNAYLADKMEVLEMPPLEPTLIIRSAGAGILRN